MSDQTETGNSLPQEICIDMEQARKLRYGENPQQRGFYVPEQTDDPLALHKFEIKQGKELSFNNMLDADSVLFAMSQVAETKPCCVIVKHGNPCGAAEGETALEAYRRAWEGDSMAAFGGIIAINRPVDEALAKAMLANWSRHYFEILLAPEITPEALTAFERRPDVRLMVNSALANPQPPHGLDVKRVRGGWLVQDYDSERLRADQIQVLSTKQPDNRQLADLLFAWGICKALRSNAVAVVKDRMLVGSGAGQQDRVRPCQLAIQKAGDRAQGAVAATDGYFPFPDGPEVLINGGVEAILHPGGSRRDQETVDLCNERGVVLAITGGLRAFKH